MAPNDELRRRNHLAPAGYLREFADENDMLCRNDRGTLVPVKDAAVKKNAYVVTLRDGTETDAVERSLEKIDAKAPPLLRNLSEIWPLAKPDRYVLTEYLAAQVVRTLDAKRRHDQLVEAAVDEALPSVIPGRHPAHESLRARAMYALLARVTRLLVGMHWSLMTFSRPVLTTCDNPVAMFPIDQSGLSDDLGTEMENIGEIWFPATPTRLLILSWRDLLSDAPRPRSGQRRAAEAVNWAMREQAETGWYWRPGTNPPVASKRPVPVGQILDSAYGPAAIRRSAHRRIALRHAAGRSDLPSSNEVLYPDGQDRAKARAGTHTLTEFLRLLMRSDR